MAVSADHQMIVNNDIQRFCKLHDLHRHRDVGCRRARVAGGMVVNEDQRSCAQFEGSSYDLAWIDRRVIDRSDALDLVGDQLVFLIEEQNAKFSLSYSTCTR